MKVIIIMVAFYCRISVLGLVEEVYIFLKLGLINRNILCLAFIIQCESSLLDIIRQTIKLKAKVIIKI